MEDHQDEMNPTTERDGYIAGKLLPGFRSLERFDRAQHVDTARRECSLSSLGRSFFADGVMGYLAGCREEADDLIVKSEVFLALAQEIGEAPSPGSTPGFDEGTRCAALSYVRWLRSGVVAPDLVAEARDYIDVYHDRLVELDRKSVEIMIPVLLYLDAYESLTALAKRLGIGVGGTATSNSRGLLNQTLRIALATIDPALWAQQDRELLEDLVAAAANQALQKARQLHLDAMQKLTGGMSIPGLGDALAQLSDPPPTP